MSQKHGTAIEWTHAPGRRGETWNPTTGCDRVSPGCANCYALTQAARLKAMHSPRYPRDGDPRTSGPGFGLTLHPDSLDQPLRWKRPRMIFVDSMSDLFHEEIPDEFIARVFDTMRLAPRHTFQILTKRPERALDLIPEIYFYAGRFEINEFANDGKALPNVWIGVSIENARYTWRADVLREIPAAVRFISAEPLLGSLLDVRRREDGDATRQASAAGAVETSREATSRTPSVAAPLNLTGIDWLIVGGESGGRFARPMHPAWARELRDACEATDAGQIVGGSLDGLRFDSSTVSFGGVPHTARRTAFFFKQWGSWAEDQYGRDPASVWVSPDGRTRGALAADAYDDLPNGSARMRYAGASPKSGGRLLDGRAWDELPGHAGQGVLFAGAEA